MESLNNTVDIQALADGIVKGTPLENLDQKKEGVDVEGTIHDTIAGLSAATHQLGTEDVDQLIGELRPRLHVFASMYGSNMPDNMKNADLLKMKIDQRLGQVCSRNPAKGEAAEKGETPQDVIRRDHTDVMNPRIREAIGW